MVRMEHIKVSLDNLDYPLKWRRKPVKKMRDILLPMHPQLECHIASKAKTNQVSHDALITKNSTDTLAGVKKKAPAASRRITGNAPPIQRKSGGVASALSKAMASAKGRISCAAPPKRRMATVRSSASLRPTTRMLGT